MFNESDGIKYHTIRIQYYDEKYAEQFVKRVGLVILLCMVLGLGSSWYYEEKIMTMQGGAGLENSVAGDKSDEGNVQSENEQSKDFIKWVEFNVTCEAMETAYQYDLDTYTKEIHLDWVDLLAYLGAKYGGDFNQYKQKDMDKIAEKLLSGETTVEKITEEMEYFSYYQEAYDAVLGGMVGEYEMEYAAETKDVDAVEGGGETTQEQKNAETKWKKVYGLKAYHPIAKNFPYSHYDDFGASRSYGFKRNHLGHDLMGSVGTPIIAVESGYVAELGWNQYGGWRVGINSFDGKRYYYYAHLRKDRPYAEGLEKGDIVQAGDVIGYLGRTGYSAEENVNNIDEYHLHFGLQLIFDESQRDSDNEIWVSGYELVKFLYKHRSEVQRDDKTKEWTRVYQIKDSVVEEG